MLHSSSDLYGASRILLYSVDFLQQEGYKVYVVLSEEGPLAEELRKIGTEVIIQRLGILRRKYFNPKGLFNRAQVLWKAKKVLKRWIVEKNIDIIYSNTSAVLVGAWLAYSTGKRHIFHLHEIIVSPFWLGKFLGMLIQKTSDQVIVVSQAVYDNWKDKIEEKKLHLIYNGLDYTPFLEGNKSIREQVAPPEKDKIWIGMIGRVSHWKGQGYFLDLAKILSEKYSNIHFIIAGDAFPGTEHLLSEMQEKIRTLGLGERVSYLGFRSDVADLLQSLDIFVLPSILPDPLPTVILEAMASAIPVIATAHGGACEMVKEGETGLLIPWNDPQKAANQIGMLIENPSVRTAMGLAGRKRAMEMFSKESFQRKFIALYENN
ncbi:glycosyltransferase [Shivajiella indica]